MSGLNYRVVLRKVGLVCPVYSNPAQMDVGASSFVVSTTNFTKFSVSLSANII